MRPGAETTEEFIGVIRDTHGLLHAPGGPSRAVCGASGTFEERPAEWAGTWCTACKDAADWPKIEGGR